MSTRTQNDAVGKTTQWMAVMAAVAPMALLAAWMHGIRQTAPDLSEFFLGPLLIGGAMIFWLLFLHLVVCRDRLPSLGLGPVRWVADLAVGVAFGAGLLVLLVSALRERVFARKRDRYDDVERMGANMRSARPFVTLGGWSPGRLTDSDDLRARFTPPPEQLSLF